MSLQRYLTLLTSYSLNNYFRNSQNFFFLITSNLFSYSYQFHKGDLFIYHIFYVLTKTSIATILSLLPVPSDKAFHSCYSYHFQLLKRFCAICIGFYSCTEITFCSALSSTCKLKICNTFLVRGQLSLVNSFSWTQITFLILSSALFRISFR